jgi:hypothetical protein
MFDLKKLAEMTANDPFRRAQEIFPLQPKPWDLGDDEVRQALNNLHERLEQIVEGLVR